MSTMGQPERLTSDPETKFHDRRIVSAELLDVRTEILARNIKLL